MAKKTYSTPPNLDKQELRDYWQQNPVGQPIESQPKPAPRPVTSAGTLPARVMLDHLDELQDQFHCVIVGFDLSAPDLAQAKVIVRLL